MRGESLRVEGDGSRMASRRKVNLEGNVGLFYEAKVRRGYIPGMLRNSRCKGDRR